MVPGHVSAGVGIHLLFDADGSISGVTHHSRSLGRGATPGRRGRIWPAFAIRPPMEYHQGVRWKAALARARATSRIELLQFASPRIAFRSSQPDSIWNGSMLDSRIAELRAAEQK